MTPEEEGEQTQAQRLEAEIIVRLMEAIGAIGQRALDADIRALTIHKATTNALLRLAAITGSKVFAFWVNDALEDEGHPGLEDIKKLEQGMQERLWKTLNHGIEIAFAFRDTTAVGPLERRPEEEEGDDTEEGGDATGR